MNERITSTRKANTMRNGKLVSATPWLKLAAVIGTWSLVIGIVTPAMAEDERYKETQAYQEYLLLPEAYKSPEMEEKFKLGYAAENAVKNHPCKSGSTVADCLDTLATNQGHDDLGWSTSGDTGQLVVERVFVTWNGNAITYRWSVDGSGTVKALSKEAEKLSRK